MTKQFHAYVALFAAALLWGGAYVANVLTLDSLPTFTLLAIRFMSASLVLFVLFYKRIRRMQFKEFLLGVPLGVMLFIAYYFQTYALNFTSVANNSILTGLYVVFTPYLVWLAYRKRPRLSVQIASVLAFVGVAIMSLDGIEISFNFGDFLTILCAITFSVSIIWAERVAHIDFRLMTFIQVTVGGLLASLAAWRVDPPVATIEMHALYAMLYLILVATTLCYLLQMFAMRHVESTKASVILSSEVLFATLFSVIFLKEPLTLNTLLSMGCMFVAVYLTTVQDK